MGDEDEPEVRAVPDNRTIQIDALADVQLVDFDRDAEQPGSAPPPLPPRRAAKSTQTRNIVLTAVAVVAGTVFALAIVHYVFPGPNPEPPPPRAIRQIRLDDELVIRAGGPATEP